MKILIIEDDYATTETILLSLKVSWSEAKAITTKQGEDGINLVEKESPDIVILDLGLPDIDGFEVLKRIRLFSNVPIVILSIRERETDVIKGLELGADEYIIKPFRQLELLARIKHILRKQHGLNGNLVINCGLFEINASTRKFIQGERVVNLTGTEAVIMQQLATNKGKTLTYSHLADEIWGIDSPGTIEAIRVYIHNLRKKIEVNPSEPQLIITKPGIGYSLRPE